MRRARSFRNQKPTAGERVATLPQEPIQIKSLGSSKKVHPKIPRLSRKSSGLSQSSRASSTLNILYQGESVGESIELETFAVNLDVGGVFNEDWELFRNLVSSIQHKYNDNPFHNFHHGFSVANMATLFLLQTPELQNELVLDADYKLAFLVAALGHDIDHPGNDNSYEVKSNSNLAQVYAQQSVLENHHIETLLKLLDEEKAQGTNVFQYLRHNKQAELKEFMREVVIGTDMEFHKHHIKTLKSLKGKDLLHQLGNPQQKSKIMQAVLHACDLSGQVLTLKLAADWEERIVAEMKKQEVKSQETHVELPGIIKTLVDGNWGFKARAEVQLGFINKVLLPLWEAIGDVFVSMKPFPTVLY